MMEATSDSEWASGGGDELRGAGAAGQVGERRVALPAGARGHEAAGTEGCLHANAPVA